MIIRLFKFGYIKVIGAVIYLSLLYLLVDIFGFGEMTAQIMMVIVTFLTKFYLNNYITWGDRRAKNKKIFLKQLTTYTVISILVSTLNILIYYIFIKLNVYYLIAAIVSGAVITLLGFWLCDRYVWKKKDEKEII